MCAHLRSGVLLPSLHSIVNLHRLCASCIDLAWNAAQHRMGFINTK